MIANLPEDLICLELVMAVEIRNCKAGKTRNFQGSKGEDNQPKNKNEQKCPVNTHEKHIPRIHGKGNNEIL